MHRKLFYCLMLTIASCSFPSRKLTNSIEKIRANSQDLKALVMEELPYSTVGYPVSKVKNGQLKRILLDMNVSEIDITYQSVTRRSDTLHSTLPFLGSDLDSTITISWIKRTENQIKYNSAYYFFGKIVPRHQVLKDSNFKDIKINDSIWIQKRVDDIVIVH